MHEKAKQFEPIPNGFRMSPHSPSTNSAPYQLLKKITGEPVTTTIDFVLPNIRTEEDRSGKMWFSSRATVTPVRRDLCRIDFVAAWNLFFLPGLIFPIFGDRESTRLNSRHAHISYAVLFLQKKKIYTTHSSYP